MKSSLVLYPLIWLMWQQSGFVVIKITACLSIIIIIVIIIIIYQDL